MSEFDRQEGEVSLPSTFYACLNSEICGLRFPVSVGDNFDGHCPRCGGATVEAAATAVTSATPFTSDLPTSHIHLLLDNWRNLFNVGAAFRTADGAGLRHLYLCGITATPDSQRKLAKTALGAERAVAWSYHADAVRLADALKREGMALWVLERSNRSVALFDITGGALTIPLVLAAGNEKAGVDPGLVDLADRVIHLPMVGRKASLNVAVAVSIAAYWLRAQEAVVHARQTLR